MDSPPTPTKDHLWQNFDKLLITGLMVTFAGVTIFLILHKADDAALQWAETLTGSMSSALLALLGAAKLQQRAADKNGNGNGTPPTDALKP